jgi:glyoxylase-like metal-dependent hydrolase (beta-lactamase superfamily II)
MSNSSPAPEVTPFFDPDTNTISYIVKDPGSAACAIVDSVLDLDWAARAHLDQIGRHDRRPCRAHGLEVAWLIETHVHADHLSAAPYLQQAARRQDRHRRRRHRRCRTCSARCSTRAPSGGATAASSTCCSTTATATAIGGLTGIAMHTPGHTPACMTHLIGNAAFVGDTLFMPDGGTARADFPGGDARQLFRSIRRILGRCPARPGCSSATTTAPTAGAIAWETTVAAEREANIHVRDGVTEDEFVAMRSAPGRDAGRCRG